MMNNKHDWTDRRCAICGTSTDVHEHHIKPRSMFGSTKKSEQELKANKVYLCGVYGSNHHNDVHEGRLILIIRDGVLRFISRAYYMRLIGGGERTLKQRTVTLEDSDEEDLEDTNS